MRYYYSDEMGELTIFWCKISYGFCTLKLLKSVQGPIFRRVIQSMKRRRLFWDTV